MKLLDCVTGQYSLVDDEDYRAWRGYQWGKDRRGYVCADFRLQGKRKRRYFLHRLIARPARGEHVHHINRCRWDNRRDNLVNVTIEQHFALHPHSKNLKRLVRMRQELERCYVAERVLWDLLAQARPL